MEGNYRGRGEKKLLPLDRGIRKEKRAAGREKQGQARTVYNH